MNLHNAHLRHVMSFADSSSGGGSGDTGGDASTDTSTTATNSGTRDREGDTSSAAGSSSSDAEDDAGDEDSDSSQSDADWKKHARHWERIAKQNKAAADKLAKLEDAQKTELQKAVERAEAAEKRAAEAENTVNRASIAAKHQVPADLLSGNTAEELEASAKALSEWAKSQGADTTKTGSVKGAGGAKDTKKLSGVSAGRERFKARSK